MGAVSQVRSKSMVMEQRSVTWRNVPIVRIDMDKENNNQEEQGGKRVRWKETLLEVRDISPRENKGRFRYPKSNRKPSTGSKIDSEVGQFSPSWSSNESNAKQTINTNTHYIPKYSLQNNTSMGASSGFGATCNHFVCNVGQPCKMLNSNQAPTQFQNAAYPAFDRQEYQNVRQNQSSSTFNGSEYQKPRSLRNRLQGSRGTISPELARVVERAQAARQIPNQKEDTDCCWKPDKRRLTLNIQSPYFSSKE